VILKKCGSSNLIDSIPLKWPDHLEIKVSLDPETKKWTL